MSDPINIRFPYDAVDKAIVQMIQEDPSLTSYMIATRSKALVEEAMAAMKQAGRKHKLGIGYRSIVSRRLQTLRRAGKISFDRSKDRWFVL